MTPKFADTQDSNDREGKHGILVKRELLLVGWSLTDNSDQWSVGTGVWELNKAVYTTTSVAYGWALGPWAAAVIRFRSFFSAKISAARDRPTD